MSELSHRMDRAAGSILDNEALTSNLDDAASEVLLDWGLSCVKMLVKSTSGLDDTEANRVISTRLRAIRRLMRFVNRRLPEGQNAKAEDNLPLLSRILEQAAIIYREGFTPPSDEGQKAFLRQNSFSCPTQFISSLRTLIEDQDSTMEREPSPEIELAPTTECAPTTESEGINDQATEIFTID